MTRKNASGVKRKRSDDKESEEDKAADLVKLRRKLHHALRELHKAVKKARVFEVQKILKKLKDARRKGLESDMLRDFEAQMGILKCLHCDRLARSALVTRLKKEKTFCAELSIQTILAELASDLISPGIPGTPMAKVQSRILSSKVLASEMTSIVDTLRVFMHPSGGSEDARESVYLDTSLDTSKRQRMMSSKVSVDGDGSGGEDEDPSSDHGATNPDDGWESGTVDASAGSKESDGEEYDESGGKGDAIPEYQQPQPYGSQGQSQFLPLLSVGFARGDSGSDISDSEPKLVSGFRNNRRSQRARRAIWEKKFGKNANHVKKKKAQAALKNRSIPTHRKAEMGNPSSRNTPTPPRVPTHRPQVRGYQNTKDSASKQRQPERLQYHDVLWKNPERPLHPSWEAKRKQKIASIFPSQGTKIVFSES